LSGKLPEPILKTEISGHIFRILLRFVAPSLLLPQIVATARALDAKLKEAQTLAAELMANLKGKV
jgi:hypothetical protein